LIDAPPELLQDLGAESGDSAYGEAVLIQEAGATRGSVT
jgi:hypothetical protein